MSEQPTVERPADGKPNRCEICGREEPDARLLEACSECGVTFHLNPRSDVEGIDCGDAVIGPELGVYFFCQRCIERAGGPAGGDPPSAGEQFAAPEPGGAPELPSAPGVEAPPPRASRAPGRRRYRRIDGP